MERRSRGGRMKTYKELQDIMTKRYNFVVDLLNEEQQRTLHEWYVDTGVLRDDDSKVI